DGRRVSASFRSDKHLLLDGVGADGFAPLSGFWQSRDGWVRTHANYPHHRARLLSALDLPGETTPESFAAALAERDALSIEDAVVANGAIGVAVRTPEQWADHPHGKAVAALPLVGFSRLDEFSARPLAELGSGDVLPAIGLRVLDFTRVIAGP